MSVTLEPENGGQPIKVRHRVRSGLHILAEATQVRVDFGRHDKIEFAFGGHIDVSDAADLEAILFTHSAPTSIGSIFQGTFRPGSSSILRVKKGWLFDGEMMILATNSPLRQEVRLNLSVNPTKFAAYAARFNAASVGELSQHPVADLLSDDAAQRRELERQTLDGNQNLIPYSPWISAVSRDWSELVRLYLTAIKQLIEADFAERASARLTDGVTLVLADPCDIPTSLKLVETHWEFQVSDSLLAFSAMERWLAAAAPDVVQTRRFDMLYHRSRAARWIKFEARKGITIAVYAKSRNRLRLEVRYRGRKGRTIGQILSAEQEFTGSTTLIDRLDLLRQDGAERINHLLSHADLTQVTQSAAIAQNFSALLSALARGPIRYRHLLPDVFAQLVASSSVDAVRKSDLFNLCEAFGRLGILKPSKVVARSPSTRFVLIEPHHSAIEALRTFLSAQADAVATPAEI